MGFSTCGPLGKHVTSPLPLLDSCLEEMLPSSWASPCYMGIPLKAWTVRSEDGESKFMFLLLSCDLPLVVFFLRFHFDRDIEPKGQRMASLDVCCDLTGTMGWAGASPSPAPVANRGAPPKDAVSGEKIQHLLFSLALSEFKFSRQFDVRNSQKGIISRNLLFKSNLYFLLFLAYTVSR